MKNIFKILVLTLTLTAMVPEAEAYTYRYYGYDYRDYSFRPNFMYSSIPNIVTRPNFTSSYIVSFNSSRVVGFGGFTPIYYR